MANTRYENFVLENRLKDQLETKLSMLDYVTVDDTLTETAGMTKKINVYLATGEAEDVKEGEGNTQSIEMSYVPREYVVGTTQARFIYTDEDEMTDPYLVDAGITKLSEALINKLNRKVNDEYWNATQYVSVASGGAVGFDEFVDAIAKFDKENEGELQLFALCNPAMRGKLRKALKDDLKYSEGYARTGYIGTVAGVPVIGDKLVPEDCVIIATKKAVTYFRKKSVSTEQDRDMNTRKNILYGRQVGLVAFTDARECVIIAPAGTKPTITTASIVKGTDVSIAGTCASGAKVTVLVNGAEAGKATVSGASWSYVLESVDTGDKVSVRANAKGAAAAESDAKTVSAS